MLKSYIIIAWKVMQRRKFFTFINLFGITFTLFILTTIIALIDYQISNNTIDVNKNKSLYISTIELLNGDRWERQTPGYYLLNRYVRTLMTPEKITIYSSRLFSEFYNGRKRTGEITYIDDSYWSFMNFKFVEGKRFGKNEVNQSRNVAVINTKLRNEVFGQNAVAGKNIEVKGVKYRVIGVVDNLPLNSNLWVPITTDNAGLKQISLTGNYTAQLLCKDDADFDKVRREIAGIEKKIDLVKSSGYEGIRIYADDSMDKFARPFGPAKEIVFTVIIIFMVLFMILPSINLVNINISRISERASEIGVRKAFGASSLTLVQQFIIENILFVLAGGIVSLILAYLLLNTMSSVFPGIDQLNFRLFFYSLIVCLFFGLISGVFPAYKMSQLNVVEALKNNRL